MNFKESELVRVEKKELVEKVVENHHCDLCGDKLLNSFIESGFVGISPDGLVDDDGIIEIKSVIASVHYANIKRQAIDPAYKWQCIGNLKFSGRDWIDFISFCSDFPIDKQLFIYRIKKEMFEENEFAMIDDRVNQFKALVDDSKHNILNSNYDNY
jgi:hypothetical protein|tara:strand:+ start:6198 stop:6665 length:468 start_codon:yes stop_codon:yes gene_type:complete